MINDYILNEWMKLKIMLYYIILYLNTSIVKKKSYKQPSWGYEKQNKIIHVLKKTLNIWIYWKLYLNGFDYVYIFNERGINEAAIGFYFNSTSYFEIVTHGET